MVNMVAEYMTHSGDDALVANAARVSFAKETMLVDIESAATSVPARTDENAHKVDAFVEYLQKEYASFSEEALAYPDHRLVNFLADEYHLLPFRHPHITLRCKVPLFVARQIGKHQIGMTWSEESRRYITSDVELFFPEVWRAKADNVKQGSSSEEVKLNTYGNGFCVLCGNDVPRKSSGPRGKWCSEKCRASHRREVDPDFRLSGAKYNAAKRGIGFHLERGDVEWVTKCPILGIDLDYTNKATTDNSPSLDRIDPAKDYTKENVWVISNKANRMKNDASHEELVQFARNILLRFNGQVVPEDGTARAACKHMIGVYNDLLEQGVAAEQARMVLPQNMMVNFVWTGSLLAWFHLYDQRTGHGAQRETAEFAEMVKREIAPLYPASWEALEEYCRNFELED